MPVPPEPPAARTTAFAGLEFGPTKEGLPLLPVAAITPSAVPATTTVRVCPGVTDRVEAAYAPPPPPGAPYATEVLPVLPVPPPAQPPPQALTVISVTPVGTVNVPFELYVWVTS